ncbi:hypothetical protein B0H10DRAFT_1213995 [Mycena sp. CBHHK59/15]|nr:hypothetical protein B0H10DRAFT_1213995 [Mycena sp. CBHHK59/15]
MAHTPNSCGLQTTALVCVSQLRRCLFTSPSTGLRMGQLHAGDGTQRVPGVRLRPRVRLRQLYVRARGPGDRVLGGEGDGRAYSALGLDIGAHHQCVYGARQQPRPARRLPQVFLCRVPLIIIATTPSLTATPRVLDVFPALAASPVLAAFGWSPLIEAAFAENLHHFAAPADAGARACAAERPARAARAPRRLCLMVRRHAAAPEPLQRVQHLPRAAGPLHPTAGRNCEADAAVVQAHCLPSIA